VIKLLEDSRAGFFLCRECDARAVEVEGGTGAMVVGETAEHISWPRGALRQVKAGIARKPGLGEEDGG
jgi:hypothetical protein